MSKFTNKTIESTITLGEVFCAQRNELGKSIAEISTATGIHKRYLQALEKGNRLIPFPKA